MTRSENPSAKTGGWPQEFFNDSYLEMFMVRSEEQLRFESEVIATAASLTPGSTVADFCCGTGDLLQSLHGRFAVEGQGVELVDDYVQRAAANIGIRVHQGDALTFDFNRRFDVVLNWHSSFGYFDSQGNRLLLTNMARHVRRGGVLLMEGYNSAHIIENFCPVLEYDRNWQGSAYHVIRTSVISDDSRRMLQNWKFEGPAGVDAFDTSIELYEPQELLQLVVNAGFRDARLMTTPTPQAPALDQPASRKSPRVLLVAKKT